MSLEPGTRFGPYEIITAIGAGGMGEVYRARDTKLGRDVAIKVLPESFATDASRVAQLGREARVLASLNHPNIASIYDFQESHGTCFLVLELVPGQTLAERLRRGPIAVREALTFAAAIADALDTAHENGIIHRDLKPANVRVTPEGRVKLLDFGLAKPALGDPRVSAPEQPTVQVDVTEPGMIVGTLLYMSPEQARGAPLDKRTDIWAFGCVLYELVTGRRPFNGETTADVIAAILGTDPKLDRLPPEHPRLASLIGRCLRRDLRQRLRDIGDARIEIDELLADTSGLRREMSARQPDLRFQRLTDAVGINESPAISPDGKMVAFVAIVQRHRQIFVRLLSGGAPLQITSEPADHASPRWAPDSNSLIFYRRSSVDMPGALWEVAALGGSPRAIVDAECGGDVSHDGQRLALFQREGDRMELLVTQRDGTCLVRIGPLPHDAIFASPRWSPDDRWIAFVVDQVVFNQSLYVAPADGGELREICQAGSIRGFTWRSDSGSLVYSSSRGSTVLYPPTYNLRTIAVDGTGDRPLTAGDVSYVDPDAHPSGKLFASRVRSTSDIWSFPVDGTAEENMRRRIRITRQTGHVQTPSMSPDGRQVIYLSDNGGHGNLWIVGIDGGAARQVTFERDPAVRIGVPLWSPAGDRIVFIVSRPDRVGLSVIRPDGGGLSEIADRAICPGWSLDGKWLYYSPGNQPPFDIVKIPVRGGPPVRVRNLSVFVGALPNGGIVSAGRIFETELIWQVTRSMTEDGPGQELLCVPASQLPMPAFVHWSVSPDGQWLAMPLSHGATTNLWVQPISGGRPQQITDFGDRPTIIARQTGWSPDSRRIVAAVVEMDADVVMIDGLT
jgi:serine/threonine protein kinase